MYLFVLGTSTSNTLIYGYTDYVLALNNSMFGDSVDHLYPIELEIKDTTDTARFASYLDLHFKIYSEGWLRMNLYDKRDDFNFLIVNFPFTSICSNIPAAPANGVYISVDLIFQSLWFPSGFP